MSLSDAADSVPSSGNSPPRLGKARFRHYQGWRQWLYLFEAYIWERECHGIFSEVLLHGRASVKASAVQEQGAAYANAQLYFLLVRAVVDGPAEACIHGVPKYDGSELLRAILWQLNGSGIHTVASVTKEFYNVSLHWCDYDPEKYFPRLEFLQDRVEYLADRNADKISDSQLVAHVLEDLNSESRFLDFHDRLVAGSPTYSQVKAAVALRLRRLELIESRARRQRSQMGKVRCDNCGSSTHATRWCWSKNGANETICASCGRYHPTALCRKKQRPSRGAYKKDSTSADVQLRNTRSSRRCSRQQQLQRHGHAASCQGEHESPAIVSDVPLHLRKLPQPESDARALVLQIVTFFDNSHSQSLFSSDYSHNSHFHHEEK